MKLFVDTNNFVSVVSKEADRSDESKAVLNRFKDNHTSVLNLMELRSVLAKKKNFERDRVEDIENRIVNRTNITFPDSSDILAANDLQEEKLLYPMDAIILTAADAIDATLVSFDSELQDHGAKAPQEIL